MKLPVIKKTKSGYSTDVDVLEKLKKEDPIIEQILEYRQLMKLNSTYVEGLKPYINKKTKRIHSFFHQTITATGRISSTEPNLQNIPTRFELGKRVRKVFKPEEGKVYLDADYSQIELRVLASISEDKHMIEAFKEGQDIHKQAASKVFKTPIDEVTKEQRSNAKAVNFGIVYGISDFGLGEQLSIGRKKAKQYIEEYLEQYSGIKHFMEEITEQAKEQGYVETLFKNIDMPTVEVLAEMQWNGMYLDVDELNKYGDQLKERLEILTKEIYELCGEEFNINSTKQLGEMLFEKLKLPVVKKTKSGYSTDVDVLEKLVEEHPVIEKILEYRQLMKLNSTYVEGMKPYINPKTKRIHSFFHQTITATGRISSTEPNLQNIPTRFELGKQLRKVFKPAENYIYIDADYSQIELRVLAHISNDEHMVQAFINGEDIHRQAASKVFNTPIDEVTKEQRSNAKAVNFGIVYGISDFGLGEQLHISRKKAKQYIDQYLEMYSGIKKFMEDIVESAKKKGYVETEFKRRRYIPELKSNNYMVRQFGQRVAMNTPIQGTAADIMKIAMINVMKELKSRNMKSKIVLQVHDEMMIETALEEVDEVKDILKEKMEHAIKLRVPLIAEVSEATNWYDCK